MLDPIEDSGAFFEDLFHFCKGGCSIQGRTGFAGADFKMFFQSRQQPFAGEKSLFQIGGVGGFSIGCSEKPIRGLLEPALMRSRFPPAKVRICKTIVSFSG